MAGASGKHSLPSPRASSGKTENNTMRYNILDNPPWWEAIALGFQVSSKPTHVFRDPSLNVGRHVALCAPPGPFITYCV
jgi:hypothetical protein